jgi:hypothetical protein
VDKRFQNYFEGRKKTCVGNITLAAPWEQSITVESGGKSVKKEKISFSRFRETSCKQFWWLTIRKFRVYHKNGDFNFKTSPKFLLTLDKDKTFSSQPYPTVMKL